MHFALLAWSNTGHRTEASASPLRHPVCVAARLGLQRLAANIDLRITLALVGSLAGLLLALPSHAAGGHHAVDDAAILESGQCQVEAWIEQSRDRRLQHLGPACRALGLEVGLNLDRDIPEAIAPLRSAGLQIKWAQEVQPGLSLGAVWASTWQSASPRYGGQSLLVPLSWAPRNDLTLHLNVGRDFHKDAADHWRYGAALEWQPIARWQSVVEQWSDGLQVHRRIGLRHLASQSLSVDLSRAQSRDTARDAWWTLGLNWVFDR